MNILFFFRQENALSPPQHRLNTLTPGGTMSRLSSGLRFGLATFMLSTPALAFGQPVNTPYDFPIKPGTARWGELNSHTDMINACQIPKTLLPHLTDSALVATCLDYPLFGDFLAFNDMQVGFEGVIANFNGLYELIQRGEAAQEALAVYKDMRDDVPLGSSDSDEPFRHLYIEMLLCQKDIRASLNGTQKKELLREAVKKYTAKRTDARSGPLFLSTSCLLMMRLLGDLQTGSIERLSASTRNKVDRFAASPFPALEMEVADDIAKAADDYITNK
jgi:hypothetical protein